MYNTKVLFVIFIIILGVESSTDFQFFQDSVQKLRSGLANAYTASEKCIRPYGDCKSIVLINQGSSESHVNHETDKIIDSYLKVENQASIKKIDKVMNLLR